jgi:hypothetical protein
MATAKRTRRSRPVRAGRSTPAPASTAASRAPRRRVAVGPPRPQYLLNEENDRMMMIIAALAAEVSALRERVDTHEVLGEQRKFAASKAVEACKLTPERQSARARAREQMLNRIYRILLEELDAARQGDGAAVVAVLGEEVAAR